MFRTVVKKEIMESIVTLKFLLISTLIVLSFVVIGFVSLKTHKQRVDDYLHGQAEYYRSYEGSMYLARPPRPLQFLASGLSDVLDDTFFMHARAKFAKRIHSQGNPIFALISMPDMASFVMLVLSLLALFHTFDCISIERERGTLALVLSNAVSRSAFLFGKWIGRYLTLLFPLIAGWILVLLLAVFSGYIAFSQEIWLRILLFILFTLLYVALWCSLGVFLSAGLRSTNAALLALFLVWGMFVLVIPRLGTPIASALIEIPSQSRVELERARIHKEKNDIWWERRSKGLPGSDPESDRRLRQEMRQVEEEYRHQQRRLNAVAQQITRISPAAAYLYVSTHLAGTGTADNDKLTEEILNYASSWTLGGGGDGRPFEFMDLRVETSLSKALPDISLLLLESFFFCMCGYLSFLRSEAKSR